MTIAFINDVTAKPRGLFRIGILPGMKAERDGPDWLLTFPADWLTIRERLDRHMRNLGEIQLFEIEGPTIAHGLLVVEISEQHQPGVTRARLRRPLGHP